MRCIDDEIPFEIPATWCWVRLRNHAEIIGGYAFPSTELKTDKGIRVIRISDISEEGFVNKSIVRYNAPSSLDNYKIAVDDILIAMTGGTVGKSLYVQSLSEDMLLNQRVAIIRNKWFEVKYIDCVIKSPHIKEYINSRKNSTNDNISMVDIANFLIPIPPLSEQKRIIEKYQEILPSIDKYNECQENLDALNANLYTNLKKSILQEAIQGKLVEQCATEEPAYILLERIKEEKKRLIKQGKLKAKDIVDSVIFKGDDNKYYEKCGNAVACIDDEIPFEVPNTWSWCRLGDLISTKTGLAYSKPNLEIKSNKMVRVLRGGNISNGSWCMKSDDVMISSEFVKQDLYLRKGYFITPAVTSWENMGKTALVRENYDDVVVGGFVLMMCPFYTDGIVEEYLNYFFQSTIFQQYCQSITNKSGQAFYNLSRNKLLQLLIPIPPVEEQKRIYHRLNDALASIMSR